MANRFELIADLRKENGKSAVRRLRNKGFIPAVVYGAGKTPVHLHFEANGFNKAVNRENFFSQILTLAISDDKEQVIVKGLQRHPVSNAVLHIDFQRISATEKLILRVPLRFIGKEVAVGAKSGGIISYALTEIEIRCLPSDLPEYIDVDISKLELNQVLHLSDLALPQGVELAHAVDEPGRNLTVVGIHEVKEVVEQEIGTADVPTIGDEDKTKAASEENSSSAEKKDSSASAKEKSKK